MRFASVVTGTSTDGLGLSLVNVNGVDDTTEVSVLASIDIPFPDEFKKSLIHLSSVESTTSEEVSSAHWRLGRIIGEELSRTGWEYDVVAFSGYSIYHGPSVGKRENGTLQIGEVSEIFARTGKAVVYDFRTTDLSLGGDGAPLIPLSDKLLFPEKGTLTLNIGGIANLTYMGDRLQAFDTGPGNILIDLCCRNYKDLDYDKDGQIAFRGVVLDELLNDLTSDPYFSLKPPKSTGREHFTESWLSSRIQGKNYSDDDVIRTVTRFTAECVKDQVNRFIDDEVKVLIVGGGGSQNPVIMSDLRELFNLNVKTFDDYGIPSRAREGVGFAIIANQTIHGRVGNTEASSGRPAVLGKILPGNDATITFRKSDQ